MRFFYFVLPLFCHFLSAQETSTVTLLVLESQTKVPIPNVSVSFNEERMSGNISPNGSIELTIGIKGEFILIVSAPDFLKKQIPILLEGQDLDLGTVLLEKDITFEKTDNLITLTESDLSDDGSSSMTLGLLQATKDVFLNRAAFDFGQAFFRVRGYDSQYGKVLVNGVEMNKLFDGRPQWNNWGGLNDVTRNQEFTNGLKASDYTFGGILGNTNIDMRPSGFRPGFRFSTSASNRTYTGRAMATYTAREQERGLAYSISASRRWAKEGYIKGTLYDAFSVFGALEYEINPQNSILGTIILASNRRGRSSAITEEVLDLVGKQYNPYWGNQNGDIRNSKERKIAEPLIMFNHFLETEKFSLNTGIAYQFGTHSRSRLGYYNAPNPDPTYYRYLPSFYINSPIGANFLSANLAKEGFLENPQLNWGNIYIANNQEVAAYLLYDDTVEDKQITVNSTGNLKIDEHFSVDFGLNFKKLRSNNFAKINDLFGAGFHKDLDPFSETANDIEGSLEKAKGDIFNYHYDLTASQLNGFLQLEYSINKWKGFLAVDYLDTQYQRNGLFQNERFLDSSIGKSEQVHFSDFGLKGGLSYRVTGRHWLQAHAAQLNKPPVLQNVFINARENNEIVPDVQSGKISTVDLSYFLRLPKITGRLTGFYTRFQNTTDINFFFVDAVFGEALCRGCCG